MADKRIFEQGADVDPVGSMRVASGSSGVPTINSTWNKIVTWLESQLTLAAASITESTTKRFVSDTEKSTWNAKMEDTKAAIEAKLTGEISSHTHAGMALATDGEVTAKTGTGLLTAEDQVLMQAQWKKDLFVSVSEDPSTVFYSEESNIHAAAFQLAIHKTMTTAIAYLINLGLDRNINSVSYSLLISVVGETSPPVTETFKMDYNAGAVVSHTIVGTSIAIEIGANGAGLYIRNNYVTDEEVILSGTFNIVCY